MITNRVWARELKFFSKMGQHWDALKLILLGLGGLRWFEGWFLEFLGGFLCLESDIKPDMGFNLN